MKRTTRSQTESREASLEQTAKSYNEQKKRVGVGGKQGQGPDISLASEHKRALRNKTGRGGGQAQRAPGAQSRPERITCTMMLMMATEERSDSCMRRKRPTKDRSPANWEKKIPVPEGKVATEKFTYMCANSTKSHSIGWATNRIMARICSEEVTTEGSRMAYMSFTTKYRPMRRTHM